MKILNKVLALSAVSLAAVGLASCDDKNPKNVNQEEVKELGLSSKNYDIDKEYYYNDYNTLAGLNVFSNKEDIVFKNISYEELIYLLESDGNHLILFGGSWCHNTRAAIGYINDYAKEYGIDTIYNFDFRLDSETRDSHIRETNGSTAKASEYNFLYGELVTRYLTNLNDWVEYKTNTSSALTYTNRSSVDVTVAKAQVPFLFLYNKDNTVNNSGITSTDAKFPIVYGFEEMVDRDEDGVYVTEYNPDWTVKGKEYITDQYLQRLKNIFEYIRTNNVTLAEYTHENYIKESFNEKKGSELFTATEKVNINTVSYRQLTWLLNQEGNSVVLLGGSWCGNTQAVINTINDYAVANELTVYIYDTKLDSGIAKTRFNYNKDLNTRATGFALSNLYTDLIENYLPNIVTLYDKTDGKASHRIDYVNANNETVSVSKAQVPYLFSYNKDAKDELGLPAPITAYYEEMLVLTATSNSYIYKTANYTNYTNGILNVLNAYASDLGITVSDITRRPTID